MISLEEFEQEIAPLRLALEQWRRKYLRYYYAGFFIAGLVLVAATFFPVSVLLAIEAVFSLHKPITSSDIAAYRIFAVLCGFSLLLAPVLSYRGEHGLSIQKAIYSRILDFFGAFFPARGGGITGADLRRSGCLEPELFFHPEEGATGQIAGMRIRFCDAALTRREKGQDIIVFKGALILCEARPYAEDASAPEFPVPDRQMLLQQMERLGSEAQAEPLQKRFWDDRLIYSASALYAGLKNAILFRFGKAESPSEKEYRLKYRARSRLTPARFPEKKNAFCEFYAYRESAEASLALIASPHALFALGSLFRPAFDDEKSERLYDTIQTAVVMAQRLAARL